MLHRRPLQMSPGQAAALLDAAMRSGQLEVYLNAAVSTFQILGRRRDVEVCLWLRRLHAEGEIEELLVQRARWRRGLSSTVMAKRKAGRGSS